MMWFLTEISDSSSGQLLTASFVGDENVLRLQITMHNLQFIQSLVATSQIINYQSEERI